MKKFELHLDALLVIALVFIVGASFIAWQRHTVNQLGRKNVDLAFAATKLKLTNAALKKELEQCQPVLDQTVPQQ